MITHLTASLETKFSKEAINHQLQNIFLDPLFANSDILRKFLAFIVDQTLLGHSNWLKEYTIAVKVLNKSTTFKPQENGIVRIHAGRLRRALHSYYNESGALDIIRISVPKGSYVPVFNEFNNKAIAEETTGTNDEILTDEGNKALHDKAIVVAVIPFRHVQNDLLENTFAEGVSAQLSTELMLFQKISVVANYTMHNLFEKITDITTIASAVGAQFVLTGNIQSQKNRLRIHVQMIHTRTSQQTWSRMYERRFTSSNIFEVQDEIVKLIILELRESKAMNEKLHKTSMMAVA